MSAVPLYVWHAGKQIVEMSIDGGRETLLPLFHVWPKTSGDLSLWKTRVPATRRSSSAWPERIVFGHAVE